MDWLSKLERKIGKYAIKNLPIYITAAYVLGLLLNLLVPGFYDTYLALDVGAIMHGQIWRVVTFVIQPPNASLIFMIFVLYLYFMIGTNLTRVWGDFRFNMYFFSGMLFHVIGAFLAYFITYLSLGQGISFHLNTTYLNLSLFFAFAAVFPDVQVLLFFIIPIKMKWMALIDAVFFLYGIIKGIASGNIAGVGVAIAAIVSLLNFLIYFLSTPQFKNFIRKNKKGTTANTWKNMANHNRYQQNNTMGKESAAGTYGSPKGQDVVQHRTTAATRHKCCICGKTEVSNPELEFRYCSKCSGAHEYCNEHLFTHVHIQ